MAFHSYLEHHYVTACSLQRNIALDPLMVAMLKNGYQDTKLVKAWMKSYGLFQGISSRDRDVIATTFLTFARTHNVSPTVLDSTTIACIYSELFVTLYRAVGRSWMSATSKLLWCIYPYDFVIFDSFVQRTLVVLQCVDNDLALFPRIGVVPKIENESDINKRVVPYYMNYQAMLKHLLMTHQPDLNRLRQQHSESYQYDIRIVDKLLWMIGDAKVTY